MAPVPTKPKIYHITKWENLSGILQHGRVWSDAKRIELGLAAETVGMSEIKRRRLEELEVKCHPGTKVGDYVPFYFCPRSIMLYILHMGNREGLSYRGGQEPIIHLVADLSAAVKWADAQGRRWAFSDRNAGTRYASFFSKLSHLPKIDWSAVENNDFRDSAVKEGKQAEFLMHEYFPWEFVEKVGVINQKIADRVNLLLEGAVHKPAVTVERGWYF